MPGWVRRLVEQILGVPSAAPPPTPAPAPERLAQDIMTLVEHNELAAVRALLAQMPSLVNRPQLQWGRCPLHVARSPEMIRLLLDAGAQIDAPGWMEASPLFEAVQRDSPDCVRALLERGAKVNLRREAGYTPLHFANSPAVAEILLRAGADQSARDRSGGTPAMRMAFDGKPEMLAFLLSRGGIVEDTGGIAGGTLLHSIAHAHSPKIEVMRQLLDAGLDPNAEDDYGRTPVMIAAALPPRGVLELLLERGAKPELAYHHRQSPLDAARMAGQPETLALLEENLRRRGLLGVFPEEPRPQQIVAVGPDEFVTTLAEGFVARFRATAEGTIQLVARQSREVVLHELCPQGDRLFALGSARTVWEFPADLSSPPVAVPFPLEGLEPRARAQALAVSPDGSQMAVAFDAELVRLWNRADGTWADLPAGEINASLEFSPDGRLLAVAASFQGGGHVSVFQTSLEELRRSDQPTALCEFERAITITPRARFVDRLDAVRFTPGGRHIVLYETSRIYHEEKPAGWRGNLVLFNVESRTAVAQASVDAEATGDSRSLRESGFGSGFSSIPLVTSDGHIALGTPGGLVVLYDAETLKVAGHRKLPGSQRAAIHAVHEFSGRLWGHTDEGFLVPAD